MKQFLITKILQNFRGSIAARIKRAVLLLIFLAVVHIPQFSHICNAFQISPDMLAMGIWGILMEGLQWLRDKYPQTVPYLNPIIEGMEETDVPKPSVDMVIKAEPVSEKTQPIQ